MPANSKIVAVLDFVCDHIHTKQTLCQRTVLEKNNQILEGQTKTNKPYKKHEHETTFLANSKFAKMSKQ